MTLRGREQVTDRDDIGRADPAEAEPESRRDRKQPGLALGHGKCRDRRSPGRPIRRIRRPTRRSSRSASPQNMRLAKAQPSNERGIEEREEQCLPRPRWLDAVIVGDPPPVRLFPDRAEQHTSSPRRPPFEGIN
jgi:hypothetical protein